MHLIVTRGQHQRAAGLAAEGRSAQQPRRWGRRQPGIIGLLQEKNPTRNQLEAPLTLIETTRLVEVVKIAGFQDKD